MTTSAEASGAHLPSGASHRHICTDSLHAMSMQLLTVDICTAPSVTCHAWCKSRECTDCGCHGG